MKTLKEFIKEACQELDEGWQNPNGITVLDKPLKDFLRTKLTECATLTAEAVKVEERDEALTEYKGLIIHNANMQAGTLMGHDAALTEIENKKKAWFDTKI